MELNKQLQTDIIDIFRNVQYGRITFFLSPQKKTLDYSVETSGKLPLSQTDGNEVNGGQADFISKNILKNT